MADLSTNDARTRALAVAQIKSDLSRLLGEMDELGLFQAGAYLAMSIHCLERHKDVYHS